MKKIIAITVVLGLLIGLVSCKKETMQDKLLHYYRLINAKKGIYVEDLKTGSSFSRNGDKKFYLGSSVRLPILIAVYYLANKNRLNLYEKIPVSNIQLVYGPGIIQKMFTAPGVKYFSIKELVRIMMYSNDYTAADILINKIGIENLKKAFEEMKVTGIEITSDNNTILKKLFKLEEEKYKFMQPGQIRGEIIKKLKEGKKSNIYNFSHSYGIDISFFIRAYQGQNTATPKAFAQLLKKLYKNELFPENWTKEVLEVALNSNSDNLLSYQLPGNTEIYNASDVSPFIMNDAGIVIDKKVNMIFVLFTNYIKDVKALTLRRFIYISRLAYENYLKVKTD